MKQRYIEYCGMSYEQASREATRLIAQVGWFQAWDRLVALRQIMLHEHINFNNYYCDRR